jgi:hypothetical protein
VVDTRQAGKVAEGVALDAVLLRRAVVVSLFAAAGATTSTNLLRFGAALWLLSLGLTVVAEAALAFGQTFCMRRFLAGLTLLGCSVSILEHGSFAHAALIELASPANEMVSQAT